jgi:endoglucanase
MAVVLLAIVLATLFPAVVATASPRLFGPGPERPARPTESARQAPTPTPRPLGVGPLRASGPKLVDADGREVRLTGVNWSGFETESFAPLGLSARSADDMLDQIAAAGFNTLRLPYSNQLFEPDSKPKGIDYGKNPTLVGLSGLQLLDWFVEGARRRGLRVILDRHRPAAEGQTGLWYTERVPEERWIKDWTMLAEHYRGNEAVIGADLHNEPREPATWGDGTLRTDWRLAAERAGNAILMANPDWLIIVEGVGHLGDDAYWWGGNLSAAAQAPVRLSRPERLVYSAHDYGPDESAQGWFYAPEYPANLPAVWRAHWAYLQQDGVAPVLVGEFGGRSVGGDAEGIWQRSLIDYLRRGGFSFTYWVWNPDDWIGGLVQERSGNLNQSKMELLTPLLWPLLGRKPTEDYLRSADAGAPRAPQSTATPPGAPPR